MADANPDAELIEEFLAESREGLDDIDAAFLALETDPSNLAPIGDIFRRMHTIKGTSGFLEFSNVQQVSHAAEGLLSKMRDEEATVTDEVVDVLLESVDTLRACFDQLEADGNDELDGTSELISHLVALRDRKLEDEAADGETADAEASDPDPDAIARVVEPTSSQTAPAKTSGFIPLGAHAATEMGPETDTDPAAAPDDTAFQPDPEPTPAPPRIGDMLVQRGDITEAHRMQALKLQEAGDTRRFGEVLVSLGATTTAHLTEALAAQAELYGLEIESHPSTASGDSSVRVDVGLLDDIVGTVGELVLSRNQLVQAVGEGKDVGRRAQELAYITSSLQEGALRTRMQRVGSAWRSLPRILRDVSRETNKSVELETSGEDTELDRTIIEAIRDPLVHLVRNAVDHGLEATAEDRIRAGKPAAGTVRVSAVQDGGHVVIDVSDDGHGIDPAKIGKLAVDKGVVTEAEIRSMSDNELVELILRPGFSTASAVTNVSGRGVGMDVVASNIQAVRGSVEILTEIGVGTTIRLTIPLTLAIVPALVVECGTESFAIPQASVLELVRLDQEKVQREINTIQSVRVLSLRDKLLPLIELDELLNINDDAERQSLTVVVVQSGEQPFGLVVSRVVKAEEIVVKPVGPHVQETGYYAGATVMGDGSAALILDIAAIARSRHLSGPVGAAARPTASSENATQPTIDLLTVEIGGIRAALPTHELERLEKVQPNEVEYTGSTAVVQYRGRLLPLCFVHHIVGVPLDATAEAPLRVVVTSESRETSVGLVVDAVLDVTQIPADSLDLVGGSGRFGVLGTVVTNGAVTELIDVDAISASVDCGPSTIPIPAETESTEPPSAA